MKLNEDNSVAKGLRSIEDEISEIALAYEEYDESDVDTEYLEDALESCQNISSKSAYLFKIFQEMIADHNL